MTKFDGDDLGLPESPIYSNYPKHLWSARRKADTRPGLVQSTNWLRENTDKLRLPLVAEEDKGGEGKKL